MPSLRRQAALLAVVFVVACDAASDSIAITNVTVIDIVNGDQAPGQTILITGDRIREVGPTDEVEIPTGAKEIDGLGRYAIPGLWDMHVHMVNDVDEPVPWDFHESVSVDDGPDIYMPIYLAFGVTGVREMSGGLASLELRDRVLSGELLGPHMVIGSPLLDGPDPLFPGGPVVSIEGPDHARDVVSELHAAGFDFLKPYSLLPALSYRALLERAEELGMEVAGELPVSVSAWEAADLGQRSIEHLTGIELACSTREEELREEYRAELEALNTDPAVQDGLDIWYRSEWEPLQTRDPARCEELYASLAQRGTWVVPTLVVQQLISYYDDPRLKADPNLQYIDPWSRDLESVADEFDPERRLRPLYNSRLDAIDDLHSAGVGILAGSDTPGGFSLHGELTLFVEGGLTPLEALRTATIGPARYLGREDESGSIAPGKIADLIVLNADPLADIQNTQRIEAVIFQGNLLGRDLLDRMLEQLASDAADWPR